MNHFETLIRQIIIQIYIKGKNYLCKKQHSKRLQQNMLIASLRKLFILTTHRKQSSNNCENKTWALVLPDGVMVERLMYVQLKSCLHGVRSF